MIDGALPYLRCPVCEGAVARAGAGSLRCPRGHTFDIARQGYVDLTAGRVPHQGDSVPMVADRAEFLAAGHYDFIAAALAEAAAAHRPAGDGPVLDAGTGTGWYLGHVLQALPGAVGVGLDVSKPALRRAARAHQRAGAVRCDLWRRLPLADASAALVLDVFAPRNAAEFRRVLRPGGALLVVTPAADHLHELVGTLGLIRVDPDKAERLADHLGGHFTAAGTTTHRRTLHLAGADLRTLVGMTPSARHVRAGDLPEHDVPVTAAVDLTVYRPA
ncbi:methyltransferase domain-containing protein [Jidongwangia harbinensis]|uniref:methyltransferase domain-containing protein n=1 Tax=Jidongwangia harbinensis TaxID=2878561 RepID=UPI001CD92C92|nr:methyltransferase domain-containing protein [Jidongwangia harbinensis]MCA2213878.1 methyltransferase domain-containing protein [Jidongwangia harbinensis]